MYTVVNGSTVIVCKLNNVRYCMLYDRFQESCLSYITLILFTKQLSDNKQTVTDLTQALATVTVERTKV